MGFFNFRKKADMNQSINEFYNKSGAVLLDVRTPYEYREGHIPGSWNIPLQSLEKIRNMIMDRKTPLYVYCRSGARSSQAVSMLGQMGYTDVKNIGGIISYSGKVVV